MGDPYAQVFDPLALLRRRVNATFAARGLRVVEMAVSPGDKPEGPHEVHILAIVADDEPPALPPADDGFDEVMRSARQAEVERSNEQIAEELLDRLNRNDGFL